MGKLLSWENATKYTAFSQNFEKRQHESHEIDESMES